jgi:isoamylase
VLARLLLPGQRYSATASACMGPWDPAAGHRCNPPSCCSTPTPRPSTATSDWTRRCSPTASTTRRLATTPTARFMPRPSSPARASTGAATARPAATPGTRRSSTRPTSRASRPASRTCRELRGTYAGLAHPAAIDYLKELGVTAVELMPVHQFVHDKHLIDRGLRNYWGYNSIGYFAPHTPSTRPTGEAPAPQVAEFKQMVKALHQAGIEVILDVVYNHTAEGNHLGPVLSSRASTTPPTTGWCRRTALLHGLHRHRQQPQHAPPHVLQLIMDSLRYWVLRCTWTASASTWPPPWRASCTRWTGCRRSSTSSSRTR